MKKLATLKEAVVSERRYRYVGVGMEPGYWRGPGHDGGVVNVQNAIQDAWEIEREPLVMYAVRHGDGAFSFYGLNKSNAVGYAGKYDGEVVAFIEQLS